MKKTILILMALAVCSNGQAQLRKGRMMINGNISFGRNYVKDHDTAIIFDRVNDNNFFSGSLRFGYLVKDNVMVGILGGYAVNIVKSESQNAVNKSTSKSVYNHYSIGLFSRYYKPLPNTRFALFAQASTMFGWNEILTTSSVTGSGPQSYRIKGVNNNFELGLNGGISWFPNDFFSVEASLGNIGYNTRSLNNVFGNSSPTQQTKNSNFSSNFDFSTIHFGLSVYFGGKKDKGK